MNRFDAINSLGRSDLFHGNWELDDDSFEPISSGFVVACWPVWVESLPDELRERVDIGGGKMQWHPRYIPEVFDCDNIAQDFGVFLNRCMAVDAINTGRPRGNSASGRFNFWREANPAKAHCRNWFIEYDGSAHVFDAGNGQLDGQTSEENKTVFYGESI